MVGRYWKNSCGSPATPVARNDSTSSVLPLRCDASTRYADGLADMGVTLTVINFPAFGHSLTVSKTIATVVVFDAAFGCDRRPAGDGPAVDA